MKAVVRVLPTLGLISFLPHSSLFAAPAIKSEIVFEDTWGQDPELVAPAPPHEKKNSRHLTDDLPTTDWKPVPLNVFYSFMEELPRNDTKSMPKVQLTPQKTASKQHEPIVYPVHESPQNNLPAGKVISTAQELLKAIAPKDQAQVAYVASAPSDPNFNDSFNNALKAALIAQAPDNTTVGPVPSQTAAKNIVINFNNVSIIEVIRFLSRISGKNFIFSDDELQFNVTIVSEEPSSIEDIMTAFLQELRIRGLFLIVQGNNILIHNNKDVRGISAVIADGLEMTEARRRAPRHTRFPIKHPLRK